MAARGFGDDSGLLWAKPPPLVKAGRVAFVRPPPNLQPTGWVAPTEFPSLAGVKRICVDVETYDPHLKAIGPGTIRGDAHVCGLAVGTDDGRRWYFPTRHEGGGNLDEGLVWRWARDELNAFTGDVVGAKLIYDLDHMWNYGVYFPLAHRFYDVQIAEPLLDDNRFSYKLEGISKDYLGVGKDEELLDKAAAAYGVTDIKSNLYRFPASYVGPYGESDVDRPLRILEMQFKKLEELGLLDLFDMESRLLPVLLAVRRRGVRVNVARAEEVREKLIRAREELLKRFRAIAGPQAEFMAPDSFVKALLDQKLIINKTAKSDQYSITRGWLEAHEGNDLVDIILAGRKINTTINTFIEGHVFNHVIKGRIHCEFVQLRDGDGGTIARFSSRNPNLQNVPSRDEEIGPLVRGLFEPDEGEDWERHDQSQMEYRLQVHFARGRSGEAARELYRSNPKTDFHKFCADMLGVDPEDKVLRKRVKNTNFAKSYGALAPKLATTFGVSISEAQKFITTYEEKLPFTKATFEAAQKAAQDNGFVRSILGRYARFPLWEPRSNAFTKRKDRKPALPHERALAEYGKDIIRAGTYKALNNVLQFSNADYVKKTMVDIWEAGLCAPDALGPFLLQVHDELDYSVPRTAKGDEASKEAKRLMEVAVPLRVPVIVESERGENWGKCA